MKLIWIRGSATCTCLWWGVYFIFFCVLFCFVFVASFLHIRQHIYMENSRCIFFFCTTTGKNKNKKFNSEGNFRAKIHRFIYYIEWGVYDTRAKIYIERCEFCCHSILFKKFEQFVEMINFGVYSNLCSYLEHELLIESRSYHR